jgi:iron complex transport system permease protein
MLAFPQFSYLLIPAAFCGSLATVILVYMLAWKRGINPVRLILAGVAVSSMLGAFSSVILLFNSEKAGGVLSFSIGSLSTRSWPQIEQVGIYMAVGFAAAFLMAGRLNILALGDEVATGLGLHVELNRFLLLAAAALLAASAVSVAGLLGFVGLIAPHMVRMLIGPDNRFLLPGAALFGGILVVVCDTVGRMVMEPSELPVGIIMALLGPPFFLYLLRGHRYAT